MKSKIQLFANQITLSPNEILTHIPSDIYAEIKAKDNHPIFAPYVIAHEGYSNPRIIGEGQTKIFWGRKAIESFKGLVKKGVKFFIGHNSDNSTNGRQDVGEVVGSFQKEIDGKLNQIAIGYFPDKKTMENKVCSIEAIGQFFDHMGETIAEGIEELTGIALGINDRPAFPETGQIGFIQAFDNADNDIVDDTGNVLKIKERKMGNLTLIEMKAEIAANGWNPGQLFDMANIMADTVFQKRLAENKKTLVDSSEWEVLTKVKSDNETLTKTQKELQDKLTKYDLDTQKATAKTRFNELIKEKKYTEKQKKFIDLQYEKLQDFSDESLTKFVASAENDYKVLATSGLVTDVVQDVKGTTEVKNEFIIEDE